MSLEWSTASVTIRSFGALRILVQGMKLDCHSVRNEEKEKVQEEVALCPFVRLPATHGPESLQLNSA